MNEDELSYKIIGIAIDLHRRIYRIDLIVNDKVLIEVKSIEALAPVHYAQTLTYLRLSGLKLGLLINFNVKTLKDSIHRIVNKL